MARVLCIEIGYTTTKICEMDDKAKNPKVYKCMEVATPLGAVSDGYLRGSMLENLKDAMKDVLAENKVRTKKVIFTIFSSKIITREVVIPAVKLNQIQSVVEANISEYFPIELEDYVIAHSVLHTFKEGENAGQHKTLVIAAEKVLIHTYEKLAQECGWTIVNIDYTGNAIRQAVAASVAGQAELFVKAELENAIVCVMKDGTAVLQRTINYGITDADHPKDDIQEKMEPLIGTLLRIIDFYTSQSQEEMNKLSGINIIGELAGYEELVSMIQKETGIPCKCPEKIDCAKLQEAVGEVEIHKYIACIGAAIAPAGMMLHSRNRQEIDYFRINILLIIFFLIAGAAIVSMSILPYREEQKKEQELKDLEATYLPAKDLYDKYKALEELYKYIDYGNKLTEHANDGLLSFLEELEEKLPSDVTVTEFQSDDEQAVITMTVADKETAAGVIQNMREFDTIMSLVVNDIVENEEDKTVETSSELVVPPTTVSFTINCMYYPSEVQAPVSAENVTEDTPAEILE